MSTEWRFLQPQYATDHHVFSLQRVVARAGAPSGICLHASIAASGPGTDDILIGSYCTEVLLLSHLNIGFASNAS